MEALLPLLIFVGGIIYSVIASSGDKKDEKRNIDPDKMERQGRSAPRRRQPDSVDTGRQDKRSGGLFDELKREFQNEYDKARGQTESNSETSSETSERVSREDVKRRLEEEKKRFEERRQQEKEQASMGRRSRDKTYRDKTPVERQQSERADRARERVRTGAYESDVEIADAAEGIGKEVTEQVRYSYGDDRTSIHERGQQRETGFSPEDLTFDKKAVVNGIIFSEILGKPKSRKR